MSGNTILDMVFDLLDKKTNLFNRLKGNPEKVFENLKEHYEELGLDFQKFSKIKLWIDNNFKDILSYSFPGIENYEFLFKKFFYGSKSVEELFSLNAVNDDDFIERSKVIELLTAFVEMYIKKLEAFYKMKF